MNEHVTGAINPSKFNEEYYKSRRDRAPAGIKGYLNITDSQHMNNTREMAVKLKRRYPDIRRALVLGCGRGELVQAFRELGVKATGVDHSSYAVNNLVDGLDRNGVVLGDVSQLSFARDGEYDLVVALDIFNCIKHPALLNALSEAARVGKRILIDVPVNPDDSTPDMSSIHDNFDVSIYSQEWWIGQFLELKLPYIQGQRYVHPEPREGSKWEDGQTYSASMLFEKDWVHPTKDTVPKITFEEGGEEFKLLWWANGPWTPTGYGVGTEQVVYKAAEGYNVAVLCNYGLEGRALRMGAQGGRYKTTPIMYPKLFEPSGGDAASLVCQNWKPDIGVTLFDVWVGEGRNAYTPRDPGWIKEMLPYWVAYVPIDHDPIPQAILNQCALADRVVAMSRFGYNQLHVNDVGAEYIPHGVYTDTFKPCPPEDKSKWRENLTQRGTPMDSDDTVIWNNEDFVIGINAANKDTKRKGYEQMFKAVHHFLVNNPDAKKDVKMYLHTWNDFPGGMPLYGLAKSIGVAPLIQTTHKWYMYSALTSERMAEIYNGFDVFFNLARNEGFGIPIIEAAACGVPTIATDFTSMTELVKNRGWLVKPITHITDMLMSNTAVPNFYEAAEYLEKAYNSPDTVRRLGEKARKNAVKKYDVETVIQPLWMDMFEDIRRGLKLKTKPPAPKTEGGWIE